MFRILLIFKICNWLCDFIVRFLLRFKINKNKFFFICIKNVVGVCYNKKYELYVSMCIN